MSQSQVTNVQFSDENPALCDLACRGFFVYLIDLVLDATKTYLLELSAGIRRQI